MNKIKKFVYTQRLYLGLLLLVIIFGSFAPGDNNKQEVLSTKQPVSHAPKELDWKPDLVAQALQKKPGLARSISLMSSLMILALLTGVIMNIKYISLKLKNKEILRSYSYSEQAKWGIWDVCKVAILFLFFAQLIYGFERLFFRLDIYSRMLINTYLLDAAVVALVIFIVTITYKQGLSSLGLSLKNWLKGIRMGIVAYISLMPVMFLIILVVLALARWLNYQPPVQPVIDLFLIEQKGAIVILSILLVAVLGPIGEEIFFRGFMYKALKNKFGGRAGLILSAAIFAGLHNNLIGFFPIMALALLLAYLYEKSGSLIPAITVHIIHNSLIILFVFLAKEVMKLL